MMLVPGSSVTISWCGMPGGVTGWRDCRREERHKRFDLDELHSVDRAQRTPTTSDSLARSTSRAVAERWLTTS